MDWLHQITSDGSQIAPRDLAMRLVGAWIAGCVIVLIYRLARRGTPATPALQPTLVLLSILVAMVTQVIGDNTARAFSLVGALSIVRFRTAVEDTLDIAFVIFAVVVGMAIGANHWLVAGLGTVFVGTAAIAVRYRPAASNWFSGESTLQVRVGIGRDPNAILSETLDRMLSKHELVAGSTGRQGTALDLTYKIRVREGKSPQELLDALNKVDGVQSVEIRQAEEK